MSEDATNKPSLYDYYKKLIPDTIIFDEVERIAWQHSITCGSFDSSGAISTDGLFFYAEGKYNNDNSIYTNAKRLFLKVYAGGVSIKNSNYNIVYLNSDLSYNKKPSQYIVIDSEDNIEFSTLANVNSIILGVKF